MSMRGAKVSNDFRTSLENKLKKYCKSDDLADYYALLMGGKNPTRVSEVFKKATKLRKKYGTHRKIPLDKVNEIIDMVLDDYEQVLIPTSVSTSVAQDVMRKVVPTSVAVNLDADTDTKDFNVHGVTVKPKALKAALEKFNEQF